MALDIQALERFYDSRIGQVTRRLIFRRIRGAWPNMAGQRVLGLGYACPYLRPLVGEAERTIAAIPEGFGAEPWGSSGLCSTGIVDDLALPFPDAFFDAALVVHGLETAEAQRPFLRELWRVLTPAGRLLVVAPNRASLWAQLETSPFVEPGTVPSRAMGCSAVHATLGAESFFPRQPCVGEGRA